MLETKKHSQAIIWDAHRGDHLMSELQLSELIHGKKYDVVDFVGAHHEGIYNGYYIDNDKNLHFDFADRDNFITNLPITIEEIL